jgi:hypothetical protein
MNLLKMIKSIAICLLVSFTGITQTSEKSEIVPINGSSTYTTNKKISSFWGSIDTYFIRMDNYATRTMSTWHKNTSNFIEQNIGWNNVEKAQFMALMIIVGAYFYKAYQSISYIDHCTKTGQPIMTNRHWECVHNQEWFKKHSSEPFTFENLKRVYAEYSKSILQ